MGGSLHTWAVAVGGRGRTAAPGFLLTTTNGVGGSALVWEHGAQGGHKGQDVPGGELSWMLRARHSVWGGTGTASHVLISERVDPGRRQGAGDLYGRVDGLARLEGRV